MPVSEVRRWCVAALCTSCIDLSINGHQNNTNLIDETTTLIEDTMHQTLTQNPVGYNHHQ